MPYSYLQLCIKGFNMKKFIVLLSLFMLTMPVIAEENYRFKGYYFSPIYYDMYKRPIITWQNHNKIVNYHAGAEDLCNSLGMRLPNKNEISLLTDYLISTGVADKRNITFWLKDNATGQIGNTYIPGSNTHAYTFVYNSLIRPIQAYLSPIDKTSGMSSSICTICIEKAPALTLYDRVNMIKEDYQDYTLGKNAFYGAVVNTINDINVGFNTKINKFYLLNIKNRLDNINADIDIQNNFTPITIKSTDISKLTKQTKELIEIFNNIVESNDL